MKTRVPGTREGSGAMTDERRLTRALSLCIREQTVSGQGDAPFLRLQSVLRELFPRVFDLCAVQTLEGGAMLLHLRGERTARPLLFLSHMDVVSAGNARRWRFPPFSGEVSQGYVYGRGAADMKGHMVCLLSAAEELLCAGWQPKGDIWFAFGSNEEIRGDSMQRMCGILQAQGVRPAFVLDEGGAVTHLSSLSPSLSAYVGVAEKGRLLFRITSDGPRAMERLTRAATRISRIRCKSSLCAATRMTLLALSKKEKGLRARVLSHQGLFKPYIMGALSRTAQGRAVTRTLLSVTGMKGDALCGDMPEISYQASVLPGDSAEELLARVRRAVRDERVRMETDCCDEPGLTSQPYGEAWDALATAIAVHFPHTAVVPCLLAGGSDARRMEPICSHVYRFSPFVMPTEELARIHNADERISVENLVRGVSFFRQILQA